MKTVFLLVFSLASTFAFAQTKEEQEVLGLCKRKFKWMVETKIDSLRDVLDDRLTYVHSNGWVQTKSDLLNDFTNGKLTYQKIEVQELKARLYNGAAIVNGRGKFTHLIGGATSTTSDLQFTETYVPIDKKWKLVARHANKMQ